jgi:hypothetical protein
LHIESLPAFFPILIESLCCDRDQHNETERLTLYAAYNRPDRDGRIDGARLWRRFSLAKRARLRPVPSAARWASISRICCTPIGRWRRQCSSRIRFRYWGTISTSSLALFLFETDLLASFRSEIFPYYSDPLRDPFRNFQSRAFGSASRIRLSGVTGFSFRAHFTNLHLYLLN